MRRAWLIALCAALAGCGPDARPKPADQVAAANDADSGDGDAGVPELPPPSCAVAVNEFLWAVEVHQPEQVRDALVGECVDESWSAAERRCVAGARDPKALGACEIRTTVAIVPGSSSPGAELGIAECDALLARYRRCMIPALLPPIKQDTEEALAESLAIWREELAKPGGAERVETMCTKLAKSLERPLSQQDCD